MIIVCNNCQAKYKFDETKLGDRPRAKTKCAKCGAMIEIENPVLAAMTLPPGALDSSPPPPPTAPEPTAPALPPATTRGKSAMEAEGLAGGTITGRDMHRMGLLELPKDKRFSLAVIQGEATGQIYGITKSRTTIGRSGNDVNLEDPESSRQHAVVEIYGERAILRDLGSTNGTYVDMEKIEHVEISNQMEFRIGSHVLMFIITDVE
jgi:predicted Zn finger-like uncharacterized protein